MSEMKNIWFALFVLLIPICLFLFIGDRYYEMLKTAQRSILRTAFIYIGIPLGWSMIFVAYFAFDAYFSYYIWTIPEYKDLNVVSGLLQKVDQDYKSDRRGYVTFTVEKDGKRQEVRTEIRNNRTYESYFGETPVRNLTGQTVTIRYSAPPFAPLWDSYFRIYEFVGNGREVINYEAVRNELLERRLTAFARAVTGTQYVLALPWAIYLIVLFVIILRRRYAKPTH